MTSPASSTKTARKPRAAKSTGKGTAKRRTVRKAKGVAHPTIHDPSEQFTPEEWHDMVATAAYYRAEARGFEGATPEDDWYEAEAEVREQLAQAEDEADDRAEAGLDLTAHPAQAQDDRS